MRSRKIFSVNFNTETVPIPTAPIGLAYVLTYLKKNGFEINMVDYFWQRNIDEIKSTLIDFDPIAVLIAFRTLDNGAYNNTFQQFDILDAFIKEVKSICSVPVVLGGTGFSVVHKQLLEVSEADYGIIGEGEKTLVALCELLAEKNGPERDQLDGISGLCYKYGSTVIVNAIACSRLEKEEHFPPDRKFIHGDYYNFEKVFPLMPMGKTYAKMPDNVPVKPNIKKIAFDIFKELSPGTPLSTKRGCDMRCNYCSHNFMYDRTVNTVPVDIVIRDIENIINKYHSTHFHISDSCFNRPISHAKDVCSGIISLNRKIEWGCTCYIKPVDEEFVKLLKDAGCIRVNYDIDTVNDDVLKQIKKGYRRSDVEKTLGLMDKYGIPCAIGLKLGFPGETYEDVLDTLTFVDTINPNFAWILSGIRLWPGTDLARKAQSEGVIKNDDDLLYPKFYLSDKIDINKLNATLKEFSEKHRNWEIFGVSDNY